MPKKHELDRKLLISLIVTFVASVIFLYLFSDLINVGPVTRIIQNNPWAIVIAAWDLAVFISAGEYLRAWEVQQKLKGGQLL